MERVKPVSSGSYGMLWRSVNARATKIHSSHSPSRGTTSSESSVMTKRSRHPFVIVALPVIPGI